MAKREPIAFFSYVRSDDDHDSGRISELRERLEGEVKMQTGRSFHIFQDRNDIGWGQQWKERIEEALLDVTFLIPVVTPSFFQSHACKKEFDTFLIREKALGENRLILPIYYVTCDEMENNASSPNPMVEILRERNWADWRSFRFESLASSILRSKIASLATMIKTSMKELESVFAASDAKASPQAPSRKATSEPSESPSPVALYIPEVPVVRQKHFTQKRLDQISKKPYYVYTTAFDEVITPSDISQPSETMRLHSLLLGHVKNIITEFDTIINEETTKISNYAKNEDIALSFLIDNSGSMRGKKINGVACWSSIISNILSQSGIDSEVLGFTTRAWKGGQSREQWVQDGRPERPGRLNDLRYVVYKSFEESFQEADTNFGIMLREGLLKENIDGEALLWAHSRMLEHSAKRKILFVISDGAPVDDSTVSSNDPRFLEAHMIATVNWLKATAQIELYGIGIEHNVSRYYGPGSPTLSEEKIGPDLLEAVRLAVTKNWSEASNIQRKSLPPADPTKVKLARPVKRPRSKRSDVDKFF